MKTYVIKRIQHKRRNGSLVQPVWHVESALDGLFVFSSHDQEIAKDVMYLLNTVRIERLARTESAEMSKEEINEWTDGAWKCVCGAVNDGSFSCSGCDLTVIGSNMERLRRTREGE